MIIAQGIFLLKRLIELSIFSDSKHKRTSLNYEEFMSIFMAFVWGKDPTMFRVEQINNSK